MQKFNPVGWFEIPTSDLDRAVTFYESVFEYTLQRQTMDNIEMAWFPMEDNASGAPGSLVHNTDLYTPSQDGSLVYFSAQSGDLDNELGRVEAAGGQVLVPKMDIGEYGFIGVFVDSEGNRVGLHSAT